MQRTLITTGIIMAALGFGIAVAPNAYADPAGGTGNTGPVQHLMVYDSDTTRGMRWCLAMLAVSPQGSGCRVFSYNDPLIHSPDGWIEYTDDPAAGARKCAHDLQQDPGVVCEVRPLSEYLSVKDATK